ncbi:MAG TPA: ribosome maturation factor RimM [Acidimicrobiales bacterium]|nr:ribosome maturation factor RimM [Acidimicrobiales bacterium]
MALLEVAKIARAHGLRGEVVVELLTNRVERLLPGSRLTTQRTREFPGAKDQFSSLEIVASRPFQHRWLVTFSGVNSREEAEALHGVVLLAEPVVDENVLFVHQLIGCEVVDQHQSRCGTVTSVQANPASDLLVVDDRFYVPVRFVTATDETHVYVDIPDGLFEQ